MNPIKKGDTIVVPSGVTYQRASKRRGGFDRTGLVRRNRKVVVVDVSPSYGAQHPALVYWRGSGGYLYAVPLGEVHQ